MPPGRVGGREGERAPRTVARWGSLSTRGIDGGTVKMISRVWWATPREKGDPAETSPCPSLVGSGQLGVASSSPVGFRLGVGQGSDCSGEACVSSACLRGLPRYVISCNSPRLRWQGKNRTFYATSPVSRGTIGPTGYPQTPLTGRRLGASRRPSEWTIGRPPPTLP